MSDSLLTTRTAPHASTLASSLGTTAAWVRALFREWKRRSRSRAELASYSFAERGDLGYAAELDAEIGKPFWKK